jgi:PAS domain S-box-containing protein
LRFPSLGDAFSLAAFAVLTVAVWRLPHESLSRSERHAAALDVSVLVIVMVVGWWELSVKSLWEDAVAQGSIGALVALTFALMGLALLVSLFWQLASNLSRGRMFVPNLLLVSSGLSLAGAELAMSGSSLGAGFRSGTVIDLGWLVCAALAGLASLYVLERGDDNAARGGGARAVLPVLTSFVCLGWGAAMLVWDLTRDDQASVPMVVAATVVVLTLTAIRQVTTIHRNAQLTERLEQARAGLETEVASRTADLLAASASLRESEERFRATFRDAPIGIALVDSTSGRILEVNSKCGDILGRGRDELLALDWSTITPLEDIPAQSAMLAMLATGETHSITLEKRYLRPDGSTVWTHVTIAPLQSGDPAQPQRLVMIEDTTSRRESAQALATAHQILEQTGALARVGGWQYDLRTDAMFWSAELYRLAEVPTGFKPTRETALDLYAPEAKPLIAAAVGRAATDGTPFDLKLPVITSTGRYAWVHTQGSAKFEDGRPVLVYAAVQDITVQREAEAALRQKSEELDRYFTSSLDLLCIANLEGTFLRLNPEWERVLGFMTEELVGRSILEHVHPEDLEATVAAMTRLEGNELVLNFENRYRAKDGTYHWIEWRSAPIGNLVYAVARDVTDRKVAEETSARLEAQMRQAQKMESVGRLAGGVAHDFNNMLGAILGNAELALGALSALDPVRADVMEIQAAARRSADLTRQLLAFARKSPVSPTLLDLNETVPGLLPMVQRLIGTGIRLHWEPGDNLWPVAIDPAQVDQALVNLCINGRDAIPEVGVITIGTSNRVISDVFCTGHPDAVPGDFVVLRVSDTGVGMPPEVLEHLFEPFYTTKTIGAGTGLGLATVYGSIRQSNGFITVASEPGAGSTFEIHLPRQAGHAEHPLGTEPAAPAPHGLATILLVEDEPALLRLSTRLLGKLGYAVLAAAGAAEALRLHAEHGGQVDLLLTDVVMPDTNGRDLAAQLTASQADLRCLFMSGHTADVIAVGGQLVPGTWFIQKPFTMQELAGAIRVALDAAPN